MADDDLAHVIFELEVEDGWPPVSAERVWAVPLGDQRFQLKNVPWFVRGVAEDDVVRAEARSASEWPTVVERLEWSGNLTIRVIPFAAGPLGGSQEEVLRLLTPLGATGEAAGTYPIVALTIPPSAERAPIRRLRSTTASPRAGGSTRRAASTTPGSRCAPSDRARRGGAIPMVGQPVARRWPQADTIDRPWNIASGDRSAASQVSKSASLTSGRSRRARRRCGIRSW